ncbi:cilia- and flagella-associated protein 157 [Esox lucius]|uniref:Cilia- and flagella-associated protein 157 n=1 Tax=Esox lucius TaxID=8010 RepID=A0A3P9A6D5_ESOLU|nr:cilia- and flagella-associated protein 157 [Esox lucius]
MSKNNGKKSDDKSTKKEALGFGDQKCFDDGLSEGVKNVYRLQIQDLEERLDRYKHKCDELEVQQKDLFSKYTTVEKEKKDIVRYLKRLLAQKEDDLRDMSEQLVGLQQAKDDEKNSFELQLSQLRHEFQDKKDKLTSENMVLVGKLATLEEFRVQKQELTAHLESLKEQLEEQRREHQTVIYSLERKAVLDNDRLRKEMQQHVAAVAAEFRRVSDKKMPDTVVRAFHENVSLTAQLSRLSGRSKELLEENEDLREREKRVRREREVSESLFSKMTRKVISNEKVIHQLMEKCKQLQADLEECARAQKEHRQLQKDHVSLLAETHALRQMQTSMLEQSERNCAEEDWLEDDRDVRGHLEAAGLACRQALKSDQEVPKVEDSELKTQDSAAVLGKGAAMKAFIPEEDSLYKLKTSPGPERSSGIGPLLKATTHLSPFKTGDPGLVPRPTLKYNHILSQMGPLSKSTRLQLHRKPPATKTRTSSSKPTAPGMLCSPSRTLQEVSVSPPQASPKQGGSLNPSSDEQAGL